jgi:hypothetical protein
VLIAVVTKAVVATRVLLSPAVGVTPVTVPVNVGDDKVTPANVVNVEPKEIVVEPIVIELLASIVLVIEPEPNKLVMSD